MKLLFASFIGWLAESASEKRKGQLRTLWNLVEDQAWSLTDIKSISDTSRYFNIAIAAGVPDGIARNLREQLREFKSQYQGARELNRLRQQQQQLL